MGEKKKNKNIQRHHVIKSRVVFYFIQHGQIITTDNEQDFRHTKNNVVMIQIAAVSCST